MGPPPNHKHCFRRSLLVRPAGDDRWFEPGLVLSFTAGSSCSRVDSLRDLMQSAGISSFEALRQAFTLPAGRWLCRPMLPLEGATVRCQMDPLLAGLLLGLCGQALYSPDRPLILTEARLARQLQLHQVRDYYDAPICP